MGWNSEMHYTNGTYCFVCVCVVISYSNSGGLNDFDWRVNVEELQHLKLNVY